MPIEVRRLSRKRAITLLILGLVLTATAQAQVQTGRIVGSVTDAQKAALPNAAVDMAAGGRGASTASLPRQIQFALKYNF